MIEDIKIAGYLILTSSTIFFLPHSEVAFFLYFLLQLVSMVVTYLYFKTRNKAKMPDALFVYNWLMMALLPIKGIVEIIRYLTYFPLCNV